MWTLSQGSRIVEAARAEGMDFSGECCPQVGLATSPPLPGFLAPLAHGYGV